MLHNNPTPTHPDTHATRVTSNDRFVSAGINLGDLLFVRRYSAWHNTQPLFEARFRHGVIDMSQDTLIALVRSGQEALAAPDPYIECSGATADLGEPA